MKYPIEFKIYPNPSKEQYYIVYFFGTKKKMYEFYIGSNNKYPQRNKIRKLAFEAICQKFVVWDYFPGPPELDVLSNEIGNLLFYKDKITSMIVSHEATHGALYYMKFLKKTNFATNKEHEEELAMAQGELTRQIWVNYYKHFK